MTARGGSVPLIAVVGVHGVGNHDPGTVALDMVELLAGAPAGAPSGRHASSSRYAGFAAHDIVVPLRPLHVRRDPWDADRRRRRAHPLLERRGYFETLHRDPTVVVPARDGDDGSITGDPGRVSHEFLRLQLECYTGTNTPRVQRTVRWDGHRASEDGVGAADVHVYEMHYADLSHGGSNVTGFLRGMYQLLLHLPTLGRQAIDAAVAERRDGRWRGIQSLYTWSVRLLTLGVPVLNVVMLLLGIALLPALKLPVGAAGGVGVVGAGLIAYAVALAGLQAAEYAPRTRVGWVLAPLVAAAGIGGLVAWYVGPPGRWADAPGTFSRARASLLAVSWIAAGALGWMALTRFEAVRRGAKLVGTVAIAAAAVTFGASAWTLSRAGVDGSRIPEEATFLTLLVFFVLLGVCWTLMYGAAILAFLIAPFGVGLGDDRAAPRRRRARAALRTAVLSLAWSASGLLFTVVVVWSGVFQYAIRHVDVFRCERASGVLAVVSPSVGWVFPRGIDARAVADYGLERTVHFPGDAAIRDSAGVEFCGGAIAASGDVVASRGDGPTIRQYFHVLLARSAGAGLPVALVLIGAGLLVLVWMALPSVQFEGTSPRRPVHDVRRSRWLGAWLRTGMDAIPLVSWLFVVATFVVIPGFSVAGRFGSLAGELRPLLRLTASMLDTTGAFLAASAVAAAATAVKVGSTALDVILDVDNYLRTYPEESTPTARIAERYASLLRYLCAYQEGGRPYDAVVIVAHSLGTAVTADVLRVLARQAGADPLDRRPDDALTRLHFGAHPPTADDPPLPVHLFTMGAPLRQLMNRFFPHRFWWVRRAPDGTDPAPEAPLPADLRAASPPAGECRPLPDELQVETWSNAYRSGDYVGRELWLDRWYQRTASDGAGRVAGADDALRLDRWERADAAGARWEACIGTGAHTHYWDATAPDVAERLDAIIDAAVHDAVVRAR